MEFNKNRKIGKSTIRGHEYYTYSIPQDGGKRKRLYGITIEELKKKIEEYEEPTITADATLSECIEHYIDFGKVSKIEEPSVRKAAAHISEGNLKRKLSDFTAEDFDAMAGDDPAVKLFLTRFLDFYEHMGIISFEAEEKTQLTEREFLEVKNAAFIAISTLEPSEDLWAYRKEFAIYLICVGGFLINELLTIRAEDVTFTKERGYLKVKGRKNPFPVPKAATKYLRKLVAEVKTGSLLGNCTRANMSPHYRTYSNRLAIRGVNGIALRVAYIIFLLKHDVTPTKISEITGIRRASILREFAEYISVMPNDDGAISDAVALAQ